MLNTGITKITRPINAYGWGEPVGGYIKIGNIVIINISIPFLNDYNTQANILRGFPLPINSGNAILRAKINTKNTYMDCIIIGDGEMRCIGNIAKGDLLFVSGAYICR